MRPIDDSSFLTPDERLSEVAGILAAGILRLRARAAPPRRSTRPLGTNSDCGPKRPGTTARAIRSRSKCSARWSG